MARLLNYLLQYRVQDMWRLWKNERRPAAPWEGSLAGKTVVLSGATSGIGLETARLFAGRGARLILLNRDAVKSEALEREIEGRGCPKPRTFLVDFASLDQVRACGERLLQLKEPIDILIHNAGVYHTDLTFSPDGIEMVFQVHHLAPFLLNHLLFDRLKAEDRARILYVNSEGHRFSISGVHTDDLAWKKHRYRGLSSYGAAKTAQLLTMLRWKEMFEGTRVTLNAMHPGNVVSQIGHQNGPAYRAWKERHVLPSAKDPAISARALLYLAMADELVGVSGKFFNLTTEERPAPHARDLSAIPDIWQASRALLNLP